MRLTYLTRIAMAGAIAAMLEFYGGYKIPVLFPQFLKLDFGDLLPMAIALTMGFRAGVLTEVVKVLIHLLLRGANPIGNLANLVAGIAFLLPTILLRHPVGSRRQALWPLILGPVTTALVMLPANLYVFLPLRGVTGTAAQAMAFTTLMPFNMLKFGLTATLAYSLLPAFIAALGQRGGESLPASAEN